MASARGQLGERSERNKRDFGEIRLLEKVLRGPASRRPGYRCGEVSAYPEFLSLRHSARPGRTSNLETPRNHKLPARNTRSLPFPSGWCPAGGTNKRGARGPSGCVYHHRRRNHSDYMRGRTPAEIPDTHHPRRAS